MNSLAAVKNFLQRTTAISVVRKHGPLVRGKGWAAVQVQDPYDWAGVSAILNRSPPGIRWGVLTAGRQGVWIFYSEIPLEQASAELQKRHPLPLGLGDPRLGGKAPPVHQPQGSPNQALPPLRQPSIPVSVYATLVVVAGLCTAAQIVKGRPILG